MALSCHRCSKDIDIAALFELQPLAELGYRHGEVADSEIGLGDTLQGDLEFALVHRRGALDDELAAREVADVGIGDKEVTVFVKLGNAEALLELFEAACLHDGGIGNV